MGFSFESGCEYCGDKKVEETAEHIITNCPKFAQQRQEYLGYFYGRIEDISNNTKINNIKRNVIKFFNKIR